MINKNPTLDIVKGIAIILVIYGHVIEHSMAPWGKDFFQVPVFKLIYTFHMPLFVFISGFLIANSLKRHNVGDVFKIRCKSLLVPFICLSVLGVGVSYALNLIFAHNTGRMDIVRDLTDQLFLKPSVWFLFTLFIISSILCYSFILAKRFGGIFFLIMYFLLMLIPNNNESALYYIQWFYLFYLAGYFVNKFKVKSSYMLVKKAGFLASVIAFSLLLAHWTKNDYIYVNKMNLAAGLGGGFLRLLYRYVMGFMGIGIVFFIGAYMIKGWLAPLLEYIGEYALDIYIIQMFILEGIFPKWIYKEQIQLDFNNGWVIYVLAPLVSMFFIVLCILISKLIFRRVALLNTLLLGGRA